MPAVFCLLLFPSFYFSPYIIVLFVPFYLPLSLILSLFLQPPGREETNLNRNGPASSSVELRVFVRTPFVCRVRARARQFRVRNLGDHVRKDREGESSSADNRNYGRNFLSRLTPFVALRITRFMVQCIV